MSEVLVGVIMGSRSDWSTMEHAAETLETLGVPNEVKVVVEAGEGGAPGNAQLLEQALINLIDNAIKFSPRGDEVRVRAWLTDGEARIEVSDHGPGIAGEHHERLFERFYLVDKARSHALGGTGLGLSIVKHIMQLHHGGVSLVSAPGEGSRFTLAWPVDPGEAPGTPASGSSDTEVVFS